MTAKPPLEKGTWALASSSRVTSDVPSAIEAVAGSGDKMPGRLGVAATFSGPAACATLAATVLSDSAKARVRVTGAGAWRGGGFGGRGPRGGGAGRAELLPALVFRRPVAELHRLVDLDRIGRCALLDGGEIDEGLERRAGLALRLDGAVELAFDVGPAADHGLDLAEAVHGAAGALAAIQLGALMLEVAAHRALRRSLELAVDCGLDDDRLADLADKIGDLLAAKIDDVLGGRQVIRHFHRGLEAGGAVGLALGDEAGVHHVGDHQAGPGGGAVGMGDGIVGRWRLQHRCENG